MNVFRSHRQTVQYIQPQHAERVSQAELLIIDEAAAIPLPMVKALLGPYLVFLCSTVNGYEGTGRSLSLKLIQQLREQDSKLGSKNAAAGDMVATGGGAGRLFREIILAEPIRRARTYHTCPPAVACAGGPRFAILRLLILKPCSPRIPPRLSLAPGTPPATRSSGGSTRSSASTPRTTSPSCPRASASPIRRSASSTCVAPLISLRNARPLSGPSAASPVSGRSGRPCPGRHHLLRSSADGPLGLGVSAASVAGRAAALHLASSFFPDTVLSYWRDARPPPLSSPSPSSTCRR